MRKTVTSLERVTRVRSPRRHLGALLSASLALVVFGAACSSDDGEEAPQPAETGSVEEVLGPISEASGEPVKVGVISDGKSAAIDNSIQFDVAEATAAYLNKHRSGLGGRPIEVVTCETQADPAKGTDCGNRMIEEGVVAVTVGESGVAESIWQPLSDANIPTMFYGAGTPSLLEDAESTFILADPNFGTLQMPISLAKDIGAKKVTSIVIDVPAALHSAQEVAPPMYEEAGLEYELVRVPPGTADMTPQMQGVVNGKPDLVFVIGNDTFCISAFNGLKAVGYTGTISAISQCVTDATREAVSADVLGGMVVAAIAPVGGTDPSTVLYETAMKTYGKNIDVTSPTGRTMFTILAALAEAVDGISGDITPETVAAAIKAMPEKELPGAAGMKFRCNGKAAPETPAVCVRGGLTTTLNEEGHPTEFEVRGSSPIED